LHEKAKKYWGKLLEKISVYWFEVGMPLLNLKKNVVFKLAIIIHCAEGAYIYKLNENGKWNCI
jgi:hypothetical protein